MLCWPFRLPFNGSRRFPGGTPATFAPRTPPLPLRGRGAMRRLGEAEVPGTTAWKSEPSSPLRDDDSGTPTPTLSRHRKRGGLRRGEASVGSLAALGMTAHGLGMTVRITML